MNKFKNKTNFISWLTIVGLIVSFMGLPTQANAATVYKYEWLAQSGNVSKDGLAHEYNNLQPGQTIDLSLTMINRSGTTIQNKYPLEQPVTADKPVPVGYWGIGTQNPQDGTPSFLDLSSFILNNNRFTYYEGEDVENNRMINFSWTIKLKNNLANGVYKLYIRPVCEYLAWTRQVKNGVTLSGTDSDIFWKFRVGSGDDSDVPPGYVRYVNPKYGFQFVYKQPTYPTILNVGDDLPITYNKNYIFRASVGVPDTGAGNTFVKVWRSKDISQVQNLIGWPLMNDGIEYTKQYIQLNGISWLVLKYHDEYANSNIELRVGQLPNGYIVSAESMGWFNSEPDQIFLNSVKPIDANVYVNNQYSFRLNVPDGYQAVVYNNPQYELFGMSIDTETPEGIGGYEDNVRISITSCSLSSDPGACLLEPAPSAGYEDVVPRFMGYITIGGKNAVWYDGTTGGSYYHYYVFNGKSYKFKFESLPNSKIIDDILSSFQFI